MQLIKQYTTATSGTVTMPDTKQDVIVIHNAAALAVTLTVAFPENPRDGQICGMASTLGVTTLTLSSLSTIVGAITGISAGGYGQWIYESTSNQWYKIA